MKNITVSVADDVYRTARIKAAERKTSVSRLVSEFLGSLASDDVRLNAARARMDKLFKKTRRFSVGRRDTRDQMHGR